jgi:hypothetical protein
MRLSADRVWKVWERPVLDPAARLLQKCLPPRPQLKYSHLSTQLSLSSLSFLVAAPYTRDHAQKAECEGLSEPVNPLPSFRQASSI